MQRLGLASKAQMVQINEVLLDNDDNDQMYNLNNVNNINDVTKDIQLSAGLCKQKENENNANRNSLKPSILELQMIQKSDSVSIHQFNNDSIKNIYIQDSLKSVEKNKTIDHRAEVTKILELTDKSADKNSELKTEQVSKKYCKNKKLPQVETVTLNLLSQKTNNTDTSVIKDNIRQKSSSHNSGINKNSTTSEEILSAKCQSNKNFQMPSISARTSRRRSKPKVFDNCIVYNMSTRRKSDQVESIVMSTEDQVSLPDISYISNVKQHTVKKIIDKPTNSIEECRMIFNSRKSDNPNPVSEMHKVKSKEIFHSSIEETVPGKTKLMLSDKEIDEPIDDKKSNICDTTLNLTSDNSINQQSFTFSDNPSSIYESSLKETPTVSVYTDAAINEMSVTEQQVEFNQITKLKTNLKSEILPANNATNEKMNEVITPKRRRGRPRKVIVEKPLTASEINNSISTEISQNITKDEAHVTENLDHEKDMSATSDELTEEEINRPIHTRRRRKRGRGRRPGRKLIQPDNDYTPTLSLRPTEFHKEYTTIEIKFIDDELTCGKCKEKIIKREWRKHNLDKHNNIGWVEGENPLNYESDEKLWRSILTIAHKQKRGVLFCDKCKTTKRSVLGFVSHYKFCGKSEEEKEAMMWTCPICRGVFMPSSQDFHERMHRDAERQERMKDSQSTDIDLDKKRKRKAAEKAASKITEFAELVKDKDEPPTKKLKKTDINSFIEKPKSTKTISNVWRGHWVRALSTHNKALCRQPGCNFAGTTLDEICDHHSKCSFTPHKAYVCKICKFLSESLKDLQNHIKTNHSEKIVWEEDSDFNTNDQSEESENGTLESERRNFKSVNKQKQYDKLLKSDRAGFLKKAKLYKEESLNVTYTPTIRWTMDFHLKNYQLTLFEILNPNTFFLLTNSDAENYLPKVKISMRTKQTKALLKYPKNIVEDSTEWKIWNRFESSITNQVPTFFVGGPVWSMAWLPIPIPMYSHEVDQYLAISTHPTMNSVHVVGKSYKFNNIIQIWNLGHLAQVPSFIPVTPKLSYAIAHQNGTIWCMEWCPSGTYGSSTLTDNEKSKNLTERMGLLAVASSDGCVHIYSLPFPEVLNFTKSESNDLPIYKTEPVVTLHVNKCLDHYGKVNWQCLKLSWSKLFGHDTIAAGFSNGYVALWNLTSNSPLLVTRSEVTLHISANQHFYAHGQAVTYVEIIPISGKRYLATASLDRCTKFWDLEDTANAIGVTKKGVAVNGAWLTHWPNIYTAYDDVLGLAHTTTYMIGLREASNKVYPLLPTNSVTYGLAVSDFANGICHGTLAGEIATIFPYQMLYFKDIDKLTKKRWLVSSIEVVDLEASQEDIKVNDVKKGNKNKSNLKDHNYMPETYEECANRFGIIFHDDLSNFKSKGTKKSERRNPLNSDTMKFSPIEQYQFTSVNRIAWNPNAWSYLWIAAGYQNGLVRILHLKPISSQNSGMKLLSEYSKKIMEETENSQFSSAT